MSPRTRLFSLVTAGVLAVGVLAGCSGKQTGVTPPQVTVEIMVDGPGRVSATSVSEATTVQADPGTKLRFKVSGTDDEGVKEVTATTEAGTATSSGVRDSTGNVPTVLVIEKVTGGRTFGLTLPQLGGEPQKLTVGATNFAGLTTSYDVIFVATDAPGETS